MDSDAPVATRDIIVFDGVVEAGHAQTLSPGYTLAHDDVSFHHIVGSLSDIETPTSREDGIAENLVVVGFQGDGFGALAICSIEKVSFDQAVGSILVVRVEFPGSPHPENFSTVPIGVRNIFKIVTPDGVRAGIIDGVSQERMHVVLSLEIAALEQVVVAAEVGPIALILKPWGVVINYGGVPNGAVMRFEVNDGKLLGIDGTLGEVQTIHHDVGGVDLQEGFPGQ